MASPLLSAATLVLWAEGLAVGFWPLLALAAILAAFCLLGLPSLLPVWLHLAVLAAALAGFAMLARSSLRRFAAPTRQQAERRLELDSGLAHRPFAALRDAPAAATDGQLQLWHQHQSRARAALKNLRLRPPHPLLAAHDPHALRAAAALALAAALVIAGPQAGSRLQAAFLPGLPNVFGGAAPVIQAWIEPPAYTGLAPIFLPAAGGAVTAPAGGRLTISITGLHRRPSLVIPGTAAGLDSIGPDSFQATAKLSSSGMLRIATLFSTLGSWDLTVLPNEKPEAAWAALPGRAGTSLATRLPWQVHQRWGVAGLQAELRPQNRPDLPPLLVPLPLPGTPKSAAGAATPDLSANPYAGLAMTGRLLVRDVSGQQAQSAPADFVLPAREFRHPLARAIVDLRRRLALHPNDPQAAADDLAALAQAPLLQKVPGLAASAITLNLAAAAALLTVDPGHPLRAAAAVPQAEDRLWTIALALDGALPDAGARALAEARENLRRGLEERARGHLSDKELAQRLDALRQALDHRLADLARQAMKQGALQKFDPSMQHLSSPAMDRLIRRLQQAVEQGRMEDAKRDMAQLERMMDELKNAHIMSPEEARQQQQAARQGRKRLGAVPDLVKRESTLLDHAQARAPVAPPMPGLPPQFQNFDFNQPNGTDDPSQDTQNFSQGAPSPPPATQDQQPPGDRQSPDAQLPDAQSPDTQSPDAQAPTQKQQMPAQLAPNSQLADARTQRALRRALDALTSAVTESGHEAPKNFDQAGRAMDQAADALTRRQDPMARDAIARAIAALQQGGQEMSRQMNQQAGGAMQLSLMPGGQSGQGGDESGDDAEDGQGGRKRDPFGRQVDGNGTTADDPNLRVPDEMEQGRSRAIQDELRRRDADRNRPKGELDYIDRLLKPF